MRLTLILALLAAATPLAAHASGPASTAPVSATPPVQAPAPPPAAWGVVDGKVAGLNSRTFTALQAIKRRNPGAFTEINARELAAAINADGKIDPAESDLLKELTQSQFRSITITVEGAGPTAEKVVSFPVSGNAKRVLQDTLNPPLDLSQAWGNGQAGWNAILAEYKKNPEQEARVLNFVQGKVAEQWEVSNIKNGYKPLRDLIGKYYGYSNSAGSDTNVGRTLLYRACNGVDRNAADAMPDFFYNWLRPAGSN